MPYVDTYVIFSRVLSYWLLLFTQAVESLEKEITILKKVKHDRIVQYYGTEREGSCVRIFMEYMEGVSDSVIYTCYVLYCMCYIV